MMRRVRILAFLLLPTLLLAGWAAHLAVKRSSLPTLRIAIAGYDPRDLLRGHYLQFRLDLKGVADAPCACLRPNPEDALRPIAAPAYCGAPPPADCPNFVTEPRQAFRYYAAQERALALERELRASPGGASVTVHFHGDGTVSFSDVETPTKPTR